MNNVNYIWPSVYRPVTLPSPCSCLLMPCAPKSHVLHHCCLLADSCSDIWTKGEIIGLEGLKYVLVCPSLLLSASVSSNSYLQALPPRPGILQENMGCSFPIGDAVFLILGIYVTKLMSFNICELEMVVFVSASTFLLFLIVNSSFHSCRVSVKVHLKNSVIKKHIQRIAQIFMFHIFLTISKPFSWFR